MSRLKPWRGYITVELDADRQNTFATHADTPAELMKELEGCRLLAEQWVRDQHAEQIPEASPTDGSLRPRRRV